MYSDGGMKTSYRIKNKSMIVKSEYICIHCKEKCEGLKNFAVHMNSHYDRKSKNSHVKIIKSIIANPEYYNDVEIPEVNQTRRFISNNARIRRTVICDKCNNEFISIKELRSHKKNDHAY